MRYFVLLMALVLSSCSHDDSQVNNGWVIYDLRPLQGGRVMYYAEDERISIFTPHTMDADGFERCEIRTVMEDRGWCYECSFWQNMYDKHKDDPGWVRIDGESWVLKPMVENVPSGWNSLGCGGRKMYINIEGKGIVVSNNCWCQGDVSDAFKDLMPDNATWATKEEFDKAPVVGYIVEGIGLVFTDREGHEVNA